MTDLIDINNLLSKHQFDFSKNHNTKHDVITLIDKTSTALDAGKAVVGCYFALN